MDLLREREVFVQNGANLTPCQVGVRNHSVHECRWLQCNLVCLPPECEGFLLTQPETTQRIAEFLVIQGDIQQWQEPSPIFLMVCRQWETNGC